MGAKLNLICQNRSAIVTKVLKKKESGTLKRIFLVFFFWSLAGFMVSVASSAEEDIWLDDEEDMLRETEVTAVPVEEPSKNSEKATNVVQDKSGPTDESPTGPSQAELDMAEAESNLITEPDPTEEKSDTVPLTESNNEADKPDTLTTQSSPSANDVSAPAGFMDEYEQNLYDTYVRYYSKKVSAEEWDSIAGNKDTYAIQEKDTLWDISKMLFDDPHYWPKLWAVNPALGNPHLIQPKDMLGFVHGTEGAPPYMTLVQPGGKGSAPLPDFLKGKKVSLPGRQKLTPVMQNIPSSLPPLNLAEKKKKPTDMTVSASTQREQATMSFLSYYMAEEPLSAIGVVADKKEYGSLFHAGQSVLLELIEAVQPGQKLTVIKDMGKLYSSTIGVRGPFGYQMQVQGEVEIVGRVPDSFDLYEAKVTKSLNPLSLSALVLNRGLVEIDYKPTSSSGTGSAQIIGVPTAFAVEKKTVSPFDLVYLNRGKANGLSVGEMYQVTANLDIKSRRKKPGYDIKVGEVKIVHTEDRFATALVTSMHHPVYVGDYISALSQGLSTQRDYDPFEDMEEITEPEGRIEENDDNLGFDDFVESDKETVTTQEVETSDQTYPEDADVFEAFE